VSLLAITGGTGFVGSHLIDLALVQGHQVRALTRRPQPDRAGVTWIQGALDIPTALLTLATGADAVLHVAGVVSNDRAGFVAGNIEGTRAMIAAAQSANVSRFVQVSSLAAREPALSDYGWSKAEADALLIGSDLDWTIVRPPAIFGPRETELRDLFRMAKWHLLPLPPAGGRLSVLFVQDLVELLLTLAAPSILPNAIVEPDDGTPNGWSYSNFVRAIGAATGHRVLPLPLPRPLLEIVARGDALLRGAKAKLTPDRVRYFCHPDFVSHLPVPADLWHARTDTRAALAETAAWYRAHALL